MVDDGVPRMIETWRIAKHLRWSTNKTAKLLTDMGLTIQASAKHEYRVVRDDFASVMPTIYSSFRADYLAGNLCSSRSGRPKTDKS